MSNLQRARNLVVIVVAAALLAGLGAKVLPSAATASSYLWSVALSGGSAYLESTPDGNVIAQSDVSLGGQSALQKFTQDGSRLWQLPATASAQPMTGFPSATDADGNTYIGVANTSTGAYFLTSIDPSGSVRWTSAEIPIQGCCGFIALGWDGNVYTSQRGSYGASQVFGFSEATGKQVRDLGFSDVTGLFAYSGGIIVVDASSTVDYYGYDGTLLKSIDGGSAVGSYEAYSAASGGNGTVFIAGYSSNTGCTVPSVEKITPTGIQWTWTNPSPIGCEQTALAATPDGGVILHDADGYVSISPQGAARWTYSVTPPKGQLSFAGWPIVDVNGNVVLPFDYTYATADSPQNSGVQLDFVSQGSAALVLPSLDIEENTCSFDFGTDLANAAAVDVGNDRAYLGLDDRCANPRIATLQAFSEPGLGEDYRLMVTTPTSGSGVGSYQLSLAPASQTATIGGGRGLETGILLDGVTNAPVSNVKLSFRIEAGPNAGMSGTCSPISCATDENGQVGWVYFGATMGVDTVQVWMDTNGNGIPDTGELHTTSTVAWIPPSTPHQSRSWAGYILTNPPLQPVSAEITVPTVPTNCATASHSSFWVGFNGTLPNTNFLPQVGFDAACSAGDFSDKCTGTTAGSMYYMWYQINPNFPQNWICSLPISPGDKVSLKVVPAAPGSKVTMTAAVIGTNKSWSLTFTAPPHASYSTMECIAEDPLTDNGHGGVKPVPFVDFGSVEFDSCSAILDYRAGSTLYQNSIYTVGKHRTYGPLAARTGPITFTGSIVSFTVTRVQG